MNDDQFVFISARPNEELFSLYDSVTTLDYTQDMDKNAVTERALKYIDSLSADNCKKALKMASKQPITSTVIDLPTSFKVRERKDLVDSVVDKFKVSFDISKVRWLYFLKVVLNAYYIHLVDENNAELNNGLKKDAMGVGDVKAKDENLTGPDMIKRLVQILLLNREADKEVIEKIKTILLEWEE